MQSFCSPFDLGLFESSDSEQARLNPQIARNTGEMAGNLMNRAITATSAHFLHRYLDPVRFEVVYQEIEESQMFTENVSVVLSRGCRPVFLHLSGDRDPV